MLKRLLSGAARLARSGRFSECAIAPNCQIDFWKVAPTPNAVLRVGEQSIVKTQIVFERSGARVYIGDRTFIGAGTITAANEVAIGNDVLIAWGVTVSDHNSHSVRFSERANDVVMWGKGEKNWDHVASSPINVRDKAWIGTQSILLRGVEIGEGAVVGAGSVVTKSVPAWTVVAGNPAKVIRELGEDER